MRYRRLLSLPLVFSAAGLLSGCSTFERDWNALEEVGEPARGMEGRWDGTWISDVNGHNGRLRCIIAPDESGALEARYHATYAGLLTFKYDVPMTVRREGDTFHFSAEADLGWLAGGVYEYEGTVVGDDFHSTYESSRDHGRFEMTRVEGEEGGEP